MKTHLEPSLKPSQQKKSELRTTLRTRRKSLSDGHQSQAATNLASLFSTYTPFVEARNISIYIENDGEIGTYALIDEMSKRGKHCYLPTVTNNAMRFHRFKKGDTLYPNKFGILEPCATAIPIDETELDLVVLPLVGFDTKGRRLGMGGGYYDRCFAFCKNSTSSKPKLVGVAHACQQVDTLPKDAWDIPMHAIITDRAVLTIS